MSLSPSAAQAILPPKIARPGTPATAVVRPRLLDLVEGTPAGGACVATAAPGYGKSVLLAQATATTATAWVHLDHRDDDPERFWAHVLAAVASSGPRSEPSTPLPRAELRPAADSGARPAVLDRLLSMLAAGSSLWLVLDGLDPGRHPEVLAELSYLMQYLPPPSRLALIARRDLGACLADARARGLLVELDERDLALTAVEVADVLELDDQCLVQEVTALTGGWPAAVAALARRLRAAPAVDVPGWVVSSCARMLLEPWLATLPAEQVELLTSTSVLDLLHPQLCDHVRARTDSAALLRVLVTDHCHLFPADSGAGAGWLARSPMLTAVLRAWPQPDAAHRHRRAADWFAERAMLAPQVKHLIAAGAEPEAEVVVKAHEDDALAGGLASTVREWYMALPAEALGGTAEWLLRLAWSQVLSGDVTAATQSLRRLEPLVDPVALLGSVAVPDSLPVQARHQPGQPCSSLSARVLGAETALLGSCLLAPAGDLRTAVIRARRAVELMTDQWSRNGAQLATLHLARVLLWLGDLSGVRSVLDEAADRPFTLPMLADVLHPGVLAELALTEGRVLDAGALLARTPGVPGSGPLVGEPSPERYLGLLAALVRAERGDVPEALDEVRTVAALQRNGDAAPLNEVRIRIAQAHLEHLAGDTRAGLRQIASARRLVLDAAPDGGLLPAVDTVEARIRLAAGDVLRGERLVRGLPPGDERALLRARVAVLRSPATAVSTVEGCEAPTPRLHVARHVLLASAHRPRSTRRSEEHLLAAADAADAHGLALALLDAPPQLLDLAARVAARHGHDGLAGLVATAARPWRPLPAAATGGAAALSRGDLELLALLPGRASNIGLAEHLSVSVNTVKTRLKRLYARLGVHDRDTAIARARELGLIPDVCGPSVR